MNAAITQHGEEWQRLGWECGVMEWMWPSAAEMDCAGVGMCRAKFGRWFLFDDSRAD